MDPLESIFPPALTAIIKTHLLSPSSPVHKTITPIFAGISASITTLSTHLAPLLDSPSTPSIIPLITLSFTLLVALLLVVWIYRVIAFWTRLALRAVFWGVVFAMASIIYQRGLVQCAGDVAAVVVKLMEFGGFVRDVWLVEYERWEAQAEATRAARR